MALLKVTGLHKNYNQGEVLKGVDFEIHKGEILSLLGPNGAGKTTLIKCLLGTHSANQGQIQYFQSFSDIKSCTQRIGCTPQDTDFPNQLRCHEILQFVAGHYPNPLDIEGLSQELGLSDLLHRKCHQISGGQKRLLSLACAFVGNPELMILDEPTVALDAHVRQRVWACIVKRVQSGTSVLLSTHHLDEAESLSDRILLLHQGRILRQGAVAEILKEVGLSQIQFQFAKHAPWPSQWSLQVQAQKALLFSADPDQATRWIVNNVESKDLQIRPASLEQAFFHLTESDQEPRP